MTVTADSLPYRPCVGMLVLNARNLVFTGQRIDTVTDAWQMPQGGIDPGESPEHAALRELKEEIGTDNVRIIAHRKKPICYDLPSELLGKAWGGHYRGQCVHWYAMRFLGTDTEINIKTASPEFSAWRWSKLHDLPLHIVPFKRALYEIVVKEFSYLEKK